MSLVAARPVLWDTANDMGKDRSETKRFVLVLKKKSKHYEMFATTVQKQRGSNRIAVACRSPRVGEHFVSVLGRSTGR